MKRFSFSVPRLIDAWRAARLADRHGRETRRDMVRQYVGPHWSEQGTSEDVPLNLISLYIGTVSRQLIPKNPRLLLSTFDKAHSSAVSAVQDWANLEIPRMKLGTTLRRIVIDALFGCGIGRVALATPSDAAARSWGPTAGEPICSRIDREDFAWDTFTGDFAECGWLGHKYRVPLVTVRENKSFSVKRRELEAGRPNPFDESGTEKIGVLGRSFYGHDEIEDMIDLWEFYLPRHRAIITLHCDESGTPQMCSDGKPLGEQTWVGPDCGPYHVLGFGWVPGNALPKGPVQDLYDLHMATNQNYRKTIGASDRTKEITTFRNEADAKRVMTANDGDTTFVEDPNDITQVVFSGKHVQQLLVVADRFKDLFDFQGGNLALLNGSSPQSPTATQDKLLNENAQAGVADMQETTTQYVSDLGRALCWFWWKHPHKIMESAAQGPAGLTIPRRVFPKGMADERGQRPGLRRDMDFDRLDARVDPFSLTPKTPMSRLSFIRQVVQELAPMMALLQQQGIAFDVDAYVSMLGEMGDEPRVSELFTVREPPADPSGATELPHDTTLPAQTQRTYTRQNVPARTERGNSMMLQNALLGNDTGGARQPKGVGA